MDSEHPTGFRIVDLTRISCYQMVESGLDHFIHKYFLNYFILYKIAQAIKFLISVISGHNIFSKFKWLRYFEVQFSSGHCTSKSCTVNLWKPDLSGIWMVYLYPKAKWSDFRMVFSIFTILFPVWFSNDWTNPYHFLHKKNIFFDTFHIKLSRLTDHLKLDRK
jgi:hypothetical protein